MAVVNAGRFYSEKDGMFFDQHQLVAGETASVQLSFESVELKFARIRDACLFLVNEMPTTQGSSLPTICMQIVRIHGNMAMGIRRSARVEKDEFSFYMRSSAINHAMYKRMENGWWQEGVGYGGDEANPILDFEEMCRCTQIVSEFNAAVPEEAKDFRLVPSL